MSMLYWRIGKQINEELLQNARAEYGEQVIKSLASQLHGLYGKGWSEKQLRHCIQFASVFTDEAIVSTLWRQLSWSHLKLVIYTGKNEEHVELMQLEQANIKVAEYLTLLPSQEILKEKLHRAIAIATAKNLDL